VPNGTYRTIFSPFRHAVLTIALLAPFANVTGAEDRAFVLDTKGQKVLLVDLTSGEIRSRATLPGSPSELLRSGDGKHLVALDPGPHSFTLCCGMKPKGPMTATLLDAETLSTNATVTVGHGMPAVSFPGFTMLATHSLLVPSVDGRRLSIVLAGYRSKKPEETLPREIVTLDTATGEIVGRVPIERTPSSSWRAGDTAEGLFFVAGEGGKNPQPAEVLFVDLTGQRIVERVTVNGDIDRAFLTPDSKWLYLLEPGFPSPKIEKNQDGRIHVVSVAERRLVSSLEAGSNPRGFFWDQGRAQALVLADGPPVPKGQVRLGEVRFLRGPEIRASVNVTPQPHLLRFLDDKAFVAGASAVSVVSLEDAKRIEDVLVDGAAAMDEFAFSKDRRRAFALFSGSSRLSILDLEAPRLMGSVTTGRGGVKFAKAFGAAMLSAAGTAASYGAGMSAAQTQGRSYFTYNVYNVGVAPPETAVVVRPDGAVAYAINSQTNDITIVDVEKATVISKEAAEARGMFLFPDGKRLAVLGKNELRLMDTSVNRPAEPLHFEDSSAVSLVFTRDGATALAWGGKDLYILDAATGAVRSKVGGLMSVSAVLFGGDEGPVTSPNALPPTSSVDTPQPTPVP